MANVIISGALYNKLVTAERLYNDIRYALRKDESLDESISCVRDIPSDVEVVEDLKKRAADSDYYKEKSEFLEERNDNQFNTIREKDNKIDHLRSLNKELEEKLKNANEVANSWKRDYERIRDQFLCPLLGILYPDNPSLNINVTDLLNDVKNLKVYGDENESMYADLKYWKERCHKLETEKGKQIEELTRRYNMIAKKLNDIHDILKEDPNNE